MDRSFFEILSSHCLHCEEGKSDLGINQKIIHFASYQSDETFVYFYSTPSLGVRKCCLAPIVYKGHGIPIGIQHRATKMVPGLHNLKYEERLQRMDLPSLLYRRLRGDVIETYKYLHGVYNINSSSFLPLSIGDSL